VRAITARPEVREYLARLVRATREHPHVMLGAGPRATIDLHSASKAAAALGGRDFVTPDDVKKVAGYVVTHRLFLRPQAELEGIDAAHVLGDILRKVKVPR
jgi:MoxR-like ATPase